MNEIPTTPKTEVHVQDEVFSTHRGVDLDRRIERAAGDSVEKPKVKDAVDPDRRVGKFTPHFAGLTNVERIADVQYGGTCWAEAIQKAVQLTVGDKTGQFNNLSTEIVAKVFNDPKKWDAIENRSSQYACERWNIPSSRYADMLKEFGVDAENKSFSHKELQAALNDNRPVLIGGDVKYLDGLYGEESGGHVLLAVDWEPDTGKYVLLDSNFNNVYKVSKETLEKFATGTWNDKVADVLVGNMTVVKTPSQWPDWRIFSDGKWQSYVDGIEVRNPFVAMDDFINAKA